MRHPEHSWRKPDPRAVWHQGITRTNTLLAAEVERLRAENERLLQALLLLLAALQSEGAEPGESPAH